MSLPSYIYEATEVIDAAIFSGDEFHANQKSRKHLRKLMARWARALDEMDEQPGDHAGDIREDEDGSSEPFPHVSDRETSTVHPSKKKSRTPCASASLRCLCLAFSNSPNQTGARQTLGLGRSTGLTCRSAGPTISYIFRIG